MATVSFGGGWEGSMGLWSGRSRTFKIGTIMIVLIGGSLLAWRLIPMQQAPETGAVADAVTTSNDAAAKLTGGAALQECRELLADAVVRLDSVPAMTAVFQKQERIDGTLQPVNVMDLKVRHEPLSVYMKWHEPDQGQEIIYRDGAFDGKILVCPAGWKRNIMRTVKIDPDGDQAMAVSRRPITNAGIWKFASRLRQTVDEELMRDPTIDVSLVTGDVISGRPCDRFTFEKPGQGAPGDFQKMVVHIDRTLGVPVACEHYRWREEDGKIAPKLEESYLFRDLDLDVELSAADFDENNPAYEFVKK